MIRRVLAAAVLVLVAVAAALALWPRLFGLQHAPIVAQVVSLRALAMGCALFTAVVLLIIAILSSTARRFSSSLALVLVVFVALNAAVLAVRGFGDASFDTKGDSDVTVLAWNTLGDVPGAEAVARIALDEDADIVSLPESTEELAIAVANIMKNEGRPMWVHTLAYDQISKARSTSLLTSIDLGGYTFDADARTTVVLPTVVARPQSGGGPTIVAVHAVAPIAGQLDNWLADLRWLEDACADGNVIMAGDFNATLDHFAGLGVEGAALGRCQDAALASGNAAVGTWPTSVPALLGAPIDHVMATDDWRVSGMRVIEEADQLGSDHRPVVVQLSPSASAG